MEQKDIILRVAELNFYYGKKHAVQNVSMDIEKNKITALIGPSGCGKTTLLRCFNRMHDLYAGNRHEGEIIFKGKNILSNGESSTVRQSRLL